MLAAMRPCNFIKNTGYLFFLCFYLSLLGLAGCSAQITDTANMLVNLSNSYAGIWKLVTGGAYLMGIGLAMRGIYYLKLYGEARTMMSSQSNLKVPVVYLFVAGILMYLPAAGHIFVMSLFGTPEVTPLGYNATKVGGLNIQATNAMLGFVQIVGLISFVRGWMIIVKSAQGAAQGTSMGKGLTHIIGGILAINIVGTKNALWSTLGIS
jgi:intracellular multiplication protein IcmC